MYKRPLPGRSDAETRITREAKAAFASLRRAQLCVIQRLEPAGRTNPVGVAHLAAHIIIRADELVRRDCKFLLGDVTTSRPGLERSQPVGAARRMPSGTRCCQLLCAVLFNAWLLGLYLCRRSIEGRAVHPTAATTLLPQAASPASQAIFGGRLYDGSANECSLPRTLHAAAAA